MAGKGMERLLDVLTYEAVVTLGVLDTLFVLDHPASGCYRLREAKAHLHDKPEPSERQRGGETYSAEPWQSNNVKARLDALRALHAVIAESDMRGTYESSKASLQLGWLMLVGVMHVRRGGHTSIPKQNSGHSCSFIFPLHGQCPAQQMSGRKNNQCLETHSRPVGLSALVSPQICASIQADTVRRTTLMACLPKAGAVRIQQGCKHNNKHFQSAWDLQRVMSPYSACLRLR